MKKIILSFIVAASSLAVSAQDMIWHPADKLPLLGKAVDDASTLCRYQRIPDSLESKVKRADLMWLGRHSAGMALRFSSNSPFISVKWRNREKGLMNHQTPTGTRGLDLYTLLPDGSWTFVNTARPDVNNFTTAARVISNMEPAMREYLLYLPLYDGIDSIYIGTAPESVMTPPATSAELPDTTRPIVMYGTSILQGGCANRPGMAHTNILTRRLNREIINLGFSGNGQLDLEIADIIAAVPDPGLIVMDCVPNVNLEQIDTLLVPFYNIIRAKHPDVPMLFVEDPLFPHIRFDKEARKQVYDLNDSWKKHYEQLAAKDPNLHYLTADHILGTDYEATVDGLHLTDLGFLRYADLLEPIIRRIALPVVKKEPVTDTPKNEKAAKKPRKTKKSK